MVDVFLITGSHRIPRRVKRKLKPLDDPDSETEVDGRVQDLPDVKKSSEMLIQLESGFPLKLVTGRH